MEQRTPEWFAARLGKVTASRIADLMAKTKTGYSTSRANYMAELVCERLTGAKTEGYTNAAMQWGIDQEEAAKAAYSFMTDHTIEEAGFIDHAGIPMAGCSPDGLIGARGLIEVKCPNSATHIDTMLTETVEGKYNLQMQFQMACARREWCDFVSFDPRMPPEMQLWIKRVERDQKKIDEIHNEVAEFLKELDFKVASLRAKFMKAAA
jgi:putative phage-type endonuclease